MKSGRVTSISPEEMEKRVRLYLPEYFMSELEKIKFIAEKSQPLTQSIRSLNFPLIEEHEY